MTRAKMKRAPRAKGAPKSKGSAPAPKTTPQKSATAPVQQCPLQAQTPCDVDKLIVKAKGITKTATQDLREFKLETTKVLRFGPVTDVKDSRTLTLLTKYDLIIDCFADPKSVNPRASFPAEVEARAYYHGRKCPSQSHALLTQTELGTRAEVAKKVPGAAELALGPTKLYAMSSYIDTFGERKENADKLDSVFGIIKAFIEAVHGDGLAQVDLRADACGVRVRGDTTSKNRELRALVRVFRKTRWVIGLKIPALGTYKAEKEGTVDVHGISGKSSTVESSAGLGYVQNKTTQSSSGEGVTANYSHSSTTQVGSQVDSYSTSRTVKDGSVTRKFEERHSDRMGQKFEAKDEQITQSDISERLSKQHGFDLIVKIDEREVPIGDTLKKIRDTLKKIHEVITDVRKLFDKVPQVGWKFTFDVSLFEGQIIVDCEPNYLPGVRALGRYYAVEHKFKGKIELKLFDITLTLSFGVEAKALDSGLVLKVEGSIRLKATISKEINLDFFSPKQVFGISSNAIAKLAVVGYVSLLGKTVADAVLSVSTGLDFAGNFVAELSTRKFDIEGTLATRPIVLTGYIRVPWWFDKKIDPPIVLLPKKDLYTFK